MRFRGTEYTGKGQIIAIVDSGVDVNDPRLAGANITGWNISLNATAHALLASDFADENGHGTTTAAAIRLVAPDAQLVCIKIMDANLQTSGDLIAAAIETAARNGATVINLSLGTPNKGKAMLLRECCALAVERGAVVVAAAHPQGKPIYPADIPEVLGVTSHRLCTTDKFFYYAPHRYPPAQWGTVSGKFVAHGYYPPLQPGQEADPEFRKLYRSSTYASAYVSGRIACLREALPTEPPNYVIEQMRKLALLPSPEMGFG